MAFARGRRRRICSTTASAAGACAVRHPNIVIAVHEDPVRRDQHAAAAEALDEFSMLIEVKDRVEHGVQTGVCAAAFGDPDGFSILINFDRAGGAPRPALG